MQISTLPTFKAFDPRTVWIGHLVLLAATAFALAAAPAAAKSKMASCQIASEGAVKFNGRCRFTAERGGSFSLSPARGGGALYGSILSVSVTIVSPGVAEVRGLTRAGINSRWGRAVRSKRNRACWMGSDFRVCAR